MALETVRRENLVKRDMDLVRLILLEVERRTRDEQYAPMKFEGHTAEEIAYNVKLLSEAGLVHALDATTAKELCWIPISLTWQGHEFLDAARENTRWNRAKKLIVEKAGTVSFDVLKDVLAALAKQALGLP